MYQENSKRSPNALTKEKDVGNHEKEKERMIAIIQTFQLLKSS